MKSRRWSKLLPALCLLGVAACATDSPSPTPEERADAAADTLDASKGGASASDASVSVRDASRMDATTGRPAPAAQCAPGRYEGQATCIIYGVLPWTAKMNFELVEKSTPLGEVTSLEIVPGAMIDGVDDNLQGKFMGQLNGTFDCATGVLTGSLDKGAYFLADAIEYNFNGPLRGEYTRDDAGMPELVGHIGTLNVTTFDFIGPLAPTGECDWTAPRVGDVGVDAGR